VPLHKRTDSGKLSTAEWALGEFVNDFPALQAYMDYRTVNKFLSTYIDPMYKQQEVHPNFRQIGTWTGRMSCARPNMQNIPVRSGPEVREVFVPRPGYKLVVADFATIEMRVLAYYLGREGTAMRDLIKGGIDTNSWIASELAATGTEPYAGAGRTPDDFAKGGPNAKLRASARHALYAILYGAGACKICEQQNMEKGPPLTANDWVVQKGYKQEGEPSCKQGGDLAKKIKGAIPGYMSLMRRIQRRIEDVGYVVTLGGRKQAVARDKSYVGMAALIQGSAADIMKAALIACQPIVDRLGGALLLIVHDEGVWEFPEDVADEALALIIEAMEGAWELDPPLKVDGTTATNYGEAK
jgi:DNA polymerase-1